MSTINSELHLVSDKLVRATTLAMRELVNTMATAQDMGASGGAGSHGPTVGPHLEALMIELRDVQSLAQQFDKLIGQAK